MKRAIGSSVGVAALLVAADASAAVGGGLAKATTVAQDVQTGLYALVGVIAILYIIYLGVMAFTEKKSWSDFGWGIVHVAAVGASVAIATWAWTAFA